MVRQSDVWLFKVESGTNVMWWHDVIAATLKYSILIVDLEFHSIYNLSRILWHIFYPMGTLHGFL